MEKNVVGITIALARDDFRIIWYLLFNSALAYLVNLTNFLVTKHTSALTLQVLGNAKGAVAVVISILIFKNPASSLFCCYGTLTQDTSLAPLVLMRSLKQEKEKQHKDEYQKASI
ncbi:hypothetical protein Bca52824_005965 [Brassica carinata]|uniref:Sugar phosphate transporter domain-containing protein n=1 Tax=Brassica carinata TaxID=52824 RepID=A0A8X7WT64_BRACI|nr:hypothetical protein Bca52824_005965 [Brassica carinata]